MALPDRELAAPSIPVLPYLCAADGTGMANVHMRHVVVSPLALTTISPLQCEQISRCSPGLSSHLMNASPHMRHGIGNTTPGRTSSGTVDSPQLLAHSRRQNEGIVGSRLTTSRNQPPSKDINRLASFQSSTSGPRGSHAQSMIPRGSWECGLEGSRASVGGVLGAQLQTSARFRGRMLLGFRRPAGGVLELQGCTPTGNGSRNSFRSVSIAERRTWRAGI